MIQGSERRARRLRWGMLAALPALILGAIGVAPVAASDDLVTPRIVGGTMVPDGKYPFQAALLAQPWGDDDFQRQFCGGSLISRWHILTAAHCVDFIGNGPNDSLTLRQLRVVVGRTVLTRDDGIRRRIARIAIHPLWDPQTARYDAAVLTLVHPISGIRPMKLPTPGTTALERPGTRWIATGWGNTIAQPASGGGGTHYANRMREVNIPLLSQDECAVAYTIDGVTYTHNATMVCAGRYGKDTCQGDSGGPLFQPSPLGGYIQLGVTSWGVGCAERGFPGVYARLTNKDIGNFILQETGGIPVQ